MHILNSIIKIMQKNVNIGLYHNMQGTKSVKENTKTTYYLVRHVEHTSCGTEEAELLKINGNTDDIFCIFNFLRPIL